MADFCTIIELRKRKKKGLINVSKYLYQFRRLQNSTITEIRNSCESSVCKAPRPA